MGKSLNDIIKGQEAFQELCEVNIKTIVAKDINEHSERYLFKAIEEIIELRKTFPSELNQWAKNQGSENKQEIKEELADTMMFLINFCLVRRISPQELLETMALVQEVNFNKLKQKKLAILNDEMLRVPNKRIGLGGGNLMPAVVFIGVNPGQSLKEDQNCWDNPPQKSAVGFLKRALAMGKTRLNLDLSDIYMTNVVKEVTEDNSKPTDTMVKFWMPFLRRELEIVNSGADPIYLTMGMEASRTVMQMEPPKPSFTPIKHPSYYMRNGFTENQYYKEELIPRLKKFDLEAE